MVNAKRIRLGVLLSGGGRTLINILDCIKSGSLNAEVAIVIASRDCNGVGRSQAEGLSTHIVPYKSFAPDRLADYSAEITRLLEAEDVDLVILAGFLSKWIIPAGYAGRVINIHPALLPRHGGQGMFGHHVHEAVIAAGESKSGCTVHFVTNEYDAGQVILQREVSVQPGDTPDDLAGRVFEQECVAYPEAIRLLAEGRIKPNAS